MFFFQDILTEGLTHMGLQKAGQLITSLLIVDFKIPAWYIVDRL